MFETVFTFADIILAIACTAMVYTAAIVMYLEWRCGSVKLPGFHGNITIEPETIEYFSKQINNRNN